jgi:GcrA cell cycle regulator
MLRMRNICRQDDAANGRHGAARWGRPTRAAMNPDWTDEEIITLIKLWPTASAKQIAGRLDRSRGSICRKAQRLYLDGLLPKAAEKHFEVKPRPGRPKPARPRPTRPRPARPIPPPPAVDDRLAMQPCALLELTAGRCYWPLGRIEAVAVLFCGGASAPGRRYCQHHSSLARR